MAMIGAIPVLILAMAGSAFSGVPAAVAALSIMDPFALGAYAVSATSGF